MADTVSSEAVAAIGTAAGAILDVGMGLESYVFGDYCVVGCWIIWM